MITHHLLDSLAVLPHLLPSGPAALFCQSAVELRLPNRGRMRAGGGIVPASPLTSYRARLRRAATFVAQSRICWPQAAGFSR